MGHVVWTLDEVKKTIPAQDTFWLGDCGCRKPGNSACKKPARVCLGFSEGAVSSNEHLGRITRKEVDDLLALVRSEKLVPRPYLSENGKPEGVCFCWPEYCYYFTGKNEAENVAGPSVEGTDMTACVSCGACVDLCYFGARKIADGTLTMDKSKCYGCGVCVDACAPGAISMKPR